MSISTALFITYLLISGTSFLLFPTIFVCAYIKGIKNGKSLDTKALTILPLSLLIALFSSLIPVLHLKLLISTIRNFNNQVDKMLLLFIEKEILIDKFDHQSNVAGKGNKKDKVTNAINKQKNKEIIEVAESLLIEGTDSKTFLKEYKEALKQLNVQIKERKNAEALLQVQAFLDDIETNTILTPEIRKKLLISYKNAFLNQEKETMRPIEKTIILTKSF